MAQMLLINPRRKKRSHRRRVKNSRRRSRRAAGGYRIKRRRIKNPRRAHKRKYSHRRHRNPRRMRRRHRNPVSMSGIKSALVPAAMGAVGGLALDVAWNYVNPYVPASLATNQYAIAAIKIAAAFGIGMIARKFLGREKGNAVMAGAVTIQIYSAASFALAGKIPGLAGPGLGAYLKAPGMAGLGSTANPAVYLTKPAGMGRLRGPRLGAYIKPGMGALGGLQGSFDNPGHSDSMF